jgi:cytochrome c553
MKLTRSLSIAALPVVAAATFFFTRPVAEGSQKADSQHGALIVASGTDYGVVACARCHAFDGAADGSGAFPKLAGLPAYYLAKELRDFASGIRADAIMSAIARKMKPEDVTDVSEYYSGRHAMPTPAPVAAPNLLTLGTRLATVGDEEKHIQACEGCHGPQGRGEAPAIPPLAGQYAHYIAFQMQMWQKGYRKNDANRQMANIASELSPQEIEAIGLYFERLPQPDPANRGGQQ